MVCKQALKKARTGILFIKKCRFDKYLQNDGPNAEIHLFIHLETKPSEISIS